MYMKVSETRANHKQSTGYALATVMVFSAVGFLTLAGILALAVGNSKFTSRTNQYFNTVEASEAATEKSSQFHGQ